MCAGLCGELNQGIDQDLKKKKGNIWIFSQVVFYVVQLVLKTSGALQIVLAAELCLKAFK